MAKNRFVGEGNGPADWQKPKHIREAIAERNKRLRAARAFCPTGPGGGIDNSCSSKDGGGGSSSSGGGGGGGGKKFSGDREYVWLSDWRAVHSERLASLRSRVVEKAEAARQKRKELQREIVSLYELADSIYDSALKIKVSRKEFREALRSAILDAAQNEEERQRFEKLPAGLLLEELSSFSGRDNPAVVAAAGKCREVQKEFEQNWQEGKRHEEAISARREQQLKIQEETSSAIWREIGRFSDEVVAKNAGSEEQAAALREIFSGKVSRMYVDAKTTPEAEKTFREGTKAKIERFLSETINPVGDPSLVANTVTVVEQKLDRAYASGGTVFLSPISSPGTYAHELGHSLEFHSDKIRAAAVAFHEHRCRQDENIKMEDAFPGHGYHESEVGNKDSFSKATKAVFASILEEGRAEITAHYAGKAYRASPDTKPYATELVSVGMEMLYHAPDRFAEADPEYFDFMVSVVSGSSFEKIDTVDRLNAINIDIPKPSATPRDGDGDGIVDEEKKNKAKR